MGAAVCRPALTIDGLRALRRSWPPAEAGSFSTRRGVPLRLDSHGVYLIKPNLRELSALVERLFSGMPSGV